MTGFHDISQAAYVTRLEDENARLKQGFNIAADMFLVISKWFLNPTEEGLAEVQEVLLALEAELEEVMGIVEGEEEDSVYFSDVGGNQCDAPGPDLPREGQWFCERSVGHKGLHWFPRSQYTSSEDYPETWA